VCGPSNVSVWELRIRLLHDGHKRLGEDAFDNPVALIHLNTVLTHSLLLRPVPGRLSLRLVSATFCQDASFISVRQEEAGALEVRRGVAERGDVYRRRSTAAYGCVCRG
jgi:hypothetical protein